MTRMEGIRPPEGAFMSSQDDSLAMQRSSSTEECAFLKDPITGKLLVNGLAKVSILELGGTIASVNSPDGKAPQLPMEASVGCLAGKSEILGRAAPGEFSTYVPRYNANGRSIISPHSSRAECGCHLWDGPVG
jgi:hypothetical protein